MKLNICISFILFALLSFGSSFAIDLQGCYKENFKITGYYSPEKGQNFYAKGNFEDEKTLNGDGTHGASGKGVFNGMIAAPNIYDFGTKIYFPDFGVGSVDDRGGAIVKKGDNGEAYNRIDIWMGKGEEGLKRAISFGVGYKQGRVCPVSSSIKVGFNMSQFSILSNFFQTTLWRVQLWKRRHDGRVGALQGYLKKLGYFKGSITNSFGDSTQSALCDFQSAVLGVKKTDFWCGYFGSSTRNGLRNHLEKKGLLSAKLEAKNNDSETQQAIDNGPIPRVMETIYIDKPKTDSKRLEASNSKQQSGIKDPKILKNDGYLQAGDTRNYQFLADIPFGSKTMEVKLLQRKLQWMGYYKKQISGIYDQDTINAVFQFQIDKKLIDPKETGKSRGWLGQKTRELLNKIRG